MTGNRKPNPELGIVIPCYNEEAVLPSLIQTLNDLAQRSPWPMRVLFVDDGSRDRTFTLLMEACRENPYMACIGLSRNFGHQTAVSAGLQHIRGDAVAIIDADLQDPPELIFEMARKWQEGFDVVYGVRRNRKEGLFLRQAYAAFYRILKFLANIEIPLDSGDFCVMDRRVVDLINQMPEHNRFIRGLRGWIGFKQIAFPYDRSARAAGETKYNLRRLFKLAFDGIVSFSTIPLRLASLLGLVAASLGLVYLIYAVIVKFMDPAAPLGWTSIIAVITFFGGIQLVVLGIIGEYLGRIFEESKRRPLYIVDGKGGWLAGGENAS